MVAAGVVGVVVVWGTLEELAFVLGPVALSAVQVAVGIGTVDKA
jgi:hypothetical protein